jgi:Cu/Ag efflux protein CusF
MFHWSARRSALHCLTVAALIGAVTIAAAALAAGDAPVPVTQATSAPRIYEATGRVVSITPGFATVAHDEIPGFMTPMTMEFELASPALARGIGPGQRVRFTLRVVGPDMVITALVPSAGGAAGPPARATPR